MSTEALDDLSCLTTPGVGRPRDGLLPVLLTIQQQGSEGEGGLERGSLWRRRCESAFLEGWRAAAGQKDIFGGQTLPTTYCAEPSACRASGCVRPPFKRPVMEALWEGAEGGRVQPNFLGQLSECAGGTFGRLTVFNTATSQEQLDGNHSKAHDFKRGRGGPWLGPAWLTLPHRERPVGVAQDSGGASLLGFLSGQPNTTPPGGTSERFIQKYLSELCILCVIGVDLGLQRGRGGGGGGGG